MKPLAAAFTGAIYLPGKSESKQNFPARQIQGFIKISIIFGLGADRLARAVRHRHKITGDISPGKSPHTGHDGLADGRIGNEPQKNQSGDEQQQEHSAHRTFATFHQNNLGDQRLKHLQRPPALIVTEPLDNRPNFDVVL